MSSRRLSFTEKRRAKLARSVAQLDRLETRNTITEPISVLGLSLSAFRGLAQIGLMEPNAMSNGLSGLVPPAEAAARSRRPAGQAPTNFIPIEIAAPIDQPVTPGGGGGSAQNGSAPAARAKAQSTDWPAAVAPAATPASTQSGISAPWHPAKGPGGGAALRRRAAVPAAASSSARDPASRPYLRAPALQAENRRLREELRAPFEASNFKSDAFIAEASHEVHSSRLTSESFRWISCARFSSSVGVVLPPGTAFAELPDAASPATE